MDIIEARQNMVDCQLRTNKVTDAALLTAMGDLPREAFWPAELQAFAYSDGELCIGEGRSMLAPMTSARMLQCLELKTGDICLAIGRASGYTAAIMGRLASVVFALHDDKDVSAKTSSVCNQLGLDNVISVTGPLEKGWSKEAPYDAIFIDGAIEILPEGIMNQMADGGRLSAIVQENGVGRATRFLKSGAAQSGRVLFDAKAPVLPNFEMPQNFVF